MKKGLQKDYKHPPRLFVVDGRVKVRNYEHDMFDLWCDCDKCIMESVNKKASHCKGLQ